MRTWNISLFLVLYLFFCTMSCQTCTDPSQPMPTSESTQLITPGQYLKFSGRYLSSSSQEPPILYLNLETPVTAAEYSETLAKFLMPDMPAGIYNISIRFYDRGLISTKLLVQYEQKINGINSNSFGTNGGVLTVSGQGFRPTSIVKLKTSDEICKTIEGDHSITSIKCILPSKADATTDEILIIDGEQTYECSDPTQCQITWSDALTPVFSSYDGETTITLSEDEAQFQFTGINLNQESVDEIFMISTGQTSENTITVLRGSLVDGYPTETILITVFGMNNINPLTYNLYINYNNKGFASLIPELTFESGGINLNVTEGEYIDSALEGTNELTILGHGFANTQNISITICNDLLLDCPIKAISNTKITCAIPELYDVYQYYLQNGDLGSSSGDSSSGSSELEYLVFEYTTYCSYCRINDQATSYMGNIFDFSPYIEADSPEYLPYLYDMNQTSNRLNTNTYYQSNTPDDCWIDFNFGEYIFTMDTIVPWAPYESYYPNPAFWWIVGTRLINYRDYLYESQFLGSNDNKVTWDLLYSWTEMHSNPYVTRREATEGSTQPPYFIDFDFITGHPWHYKVWRWKMQGGDSSYHLCRVGGIEFEGSGYLEIQEETNYKLCSVTLSIEDQSTTWEDIVKYDQAMSSVALTISPIFGSRNGGTPVIITGINFPTTGTIEVYIHGVECTVSTWSETQIECVTGPQPLLVEEQTIDIIFDGIYYSSVNPCMLYSYVNQWSDKNTWGGELPPLEGETIFVPQGQSLSINQNTGYLNAIMIEGEVIVEDMDIVIEANYIIVANGGKLIIGTPVNPFQHKATIILHGNQETDKQLPLYGAKVLALYDGFLSIFGKPITPTWTKLSGSVTAGATVLILEHEVSGWSVGDEIIITSTSYLPTQTEKRVIESITGNTLTITEPLQFNHYGESETYGNSETVNMAAEVALLSRNIVIKGDDEYSELQSYGAHILGYGTPKSTSQISISYTEIYQAGQAYFSKRYPLNFDNLNIQPFSYAIGNSIHRSYARMINLQKSMGIRISKNVGYDIQGSGIVLSEGGSQMNIILENLVANVQKTWNLFTEDQSPACFLITSPNNNVTGNIAAGSPYVGYYLDYDTFSQSLFNSYAMALLQFSNNTAHSNYYGLYLPSFDPRQNPLLGVPLQCGDDSANPRLLAIFSNCTLFKNRVYGLLLTKIGKVQFNNFKIVDSGNSAIFLRETQNLLLDDAQIINTLIVGKSNGNAEVDGYYTNQHGIELPNNENLQLQNIWFENYEQGPAILTCASCGSYYYRTSGAHVFRTRQLGFTNVAYRVRYGGYQQNEIFLDEDGSLVNQNIEGKTWYLTKWQAHLNGTDSEEDTPACQNYDTDESLINMYHNSIVCDSSLRKIHKLQIKSISPSNKFINQKMHIYRFPRGSLSQPDYDFTLALEEESNPDNFTNITHYSYYKDVSYSWAMPFLTGYGYNIHWGIGIDFTSLIIQVSDYFLVDDENIFLRFNHTWNRETFDNNLTTGCPAETIVINKSNSIQDSTFNTSHANYFHDNLTKEVIVNIGGQDNAASSSIKLVSIKCRDFCPPEPPKPENVTMNWSNCSAWPSGACPIQDENVTIDPGYFVTMDINPPCLGNLIINGQLIFDKTRISEFAPSKLCAKNIWIQSGAMIAGSEEEPFPGFINIEMIGNKTTQGLVLQLVDVGNKAIVVTGELKLYGKKIEKPSTKLKIPAKQGDNIIQVVDQIGWKIGDELLITGTESEIESQERRIITSIDETDPTLITLDTALDYLHYGDSNPINTRSREIDIRANVEVISKSIVITALEEWGFKIIETMEFNSSNYQTYAGSMVLDNIKLDKCGQSDLIGACIEFINSTREEMTTLLNQISIVDSFDQGILIQNSQNIILQNSVITSCTKFGIKLENALNITINNNIISNIKERLLQPTSQLDIIAGIYLKGIENDKFYIEKNLVTGVNGFAFVLDGQDCTYTDNDKKFITNIAQSSTVGWYVRNAKKYKCLYIGEFTAAKCKYGITSYQQENQMKFESLNLIENKYSIKVLAGNSENSTIDNSVTMSNMYFQALGRPNCTSCYSSYSLCSQQTGIKFIGFTLNYQQFPPNEYSSNTLETIFRICSEGGLSMKTIITSSEFQGFYSEYGQGIYSACANNKVFSTNRDTIDGASSVYLKNTECNNCDSAGIANYDAIYGFGTSQCGDYNCTGLQNIMITDETGGFINSKPSQIIPKFQEGYGNILNGASCEYIEKIPGYICSGETFGLLIAQSKDSDMRTRIISPLNITRFGQEENNQTLMFQNLVNSFRSPRCQDEFYEDKYWQRFIGLVQLNTEYNINFGTLTLPVNTFYSLQETTDSDFIVLTINYNTAQSIRVETSDGIIAPTRLDLASNFNELLWSTKCGANLFNYINQTIRVSLLSGSCKVEIKVVNAIRINMYFETTVDDFYENDGIATFVDKVAAYLGINIWQLKIVSFSPFDGRRLLEEQETNKTQLSKMIFFLENIYPASSTNSVDQDEFKKQLKPQIDRFIAGIKCGNLSFHKRVNFIETEYASANNSELEDSEKIKFTPNYTEIYEYQCKTLGNCEGFENEIQVVNNSSYIVARSEIDDDSSNNKLIIILTISFSGLFLILMGLLIWKMYISRKKKLTNINPNKQQDQAAKQLDVNEKPSITDQTSDNQLRETTQNRARTFQPLIVTDYQSPKPASGYIDSPTEFISPIQSGKYIQENKEKTGSDEELLKSSTKSETHLPPPMRRPKLRTSQFQHLKESNDHDESEEVEVIHFD